MIKKLKIEDFQRIMEFVEKGKAIPDAERKQMELIGEEILKAKDRNELRIVVSKYFEGDSDHLTLMLSSLLGWGDEGRKAS
jgi:hypothetical protein